MPLAELDRLVPAPACSGEQVVLDTPVDLVGGVAVLAHHVQVRLAVLLELVVGTDRRRDLARRPVCLAGHERGDRCGDGATLVRVVGKAARHQERAEVRVAEPELAHRARVARDLLGRVAREADDDLLGQEDDVDRVLEALDVERAVLAQELQEVDRGEVAGRVVDVHVFASTGWTH